MLFNVTPKFDFGPLIFSGQTVSAGPVIKQLSEFVWKLVPILRALKMFFNRIFLSLSSFQWKLWCLWTQRTEDNLTNSEVKSTTIRWQAKYTSWETMKSFGDTSYLLLVIICWSSTITLYLSVVSSAPNDSYREKLRSLIMPRRWNKSVSFGDDSHPYRVQVGGMGRIMTILIHGVFGTSFTVTQSYLLF